MLGVRDKLLYEPPDLGTVLYLPGLPGAGSKVYDRSPYGNHGTINGATWARLPSGLWYNSFDGTDDKITIPHATSLNLTNTWTLGAWVKADAVPRHVGIISKYLSLALDFAFTIQDSGVLALIHYISDVELYVISTGTVDDSTWHFVVGQNDGTDLRTYIDAVLDGTGANQGGITDNDGSLVQIGLWRATEWYKGSIARPFIYTSVLTVPQIQNMRNQTRHLFGV